MVHNPFALSKKAAAENLSTHFTGAGLGWFLSDYEGRRLVFHGGGHKGINSRPVLVPEENLGIVILNNNMSSIMAPLASYSVDQFLGTSNGRD